MSQNTNFIVGIGGPDLGTVIENVQFKSLKINTSHSIAIGNLIPASTTQGVKSILIGNSAGITSAQGNFAIAIGDYAGNTNQGTNAIAIGSNAGQTNQGQNSIAIGSNSSVTGTSSVAIGNNATTSTFTNSVALGTGATSTADNQIRLGTASQNVSILGNVGIGTQTPQFSLDVNGNARIGTTSTNTFTLFNTPFYYSDWISAINPTLGATALQSFITGSTTNPTIQTSGGASMYIYRVEGKTLYCRFMLLTGNTTPGSNLGSGAYLILLPGGYTIDGTVSSFASPAVPTITANSKIILQNVNNAGGLSGTQIGYGWIKGGATTTFDANPILVFAHSATQIIIIQMSNNNIFGSAWRPVNQINCMTSVDFSVPIA